MYEQTVSDALKEERYLITCIYLERLKEIVLKINPKAEFCIFGSVAERDTTSTLCFW